MRIKTLLSAAVLQTIMMGGGLGLAQEPQVPSDPPDLAACTAAGLTQEQCQQCMASGLTIEECLNQQAQVSPSALEGAEEGAAPGGVPELPTPPPLPPNTP